MMKPSFFLYALVFLFFSAVDDSNGQLLQPRVKWGKEFNAPKRSSLNDIVGFDNSGIYAIKERYGFSSVRYTLEHYNNDFIPDKTFDLDLEENGRDVLVEKILHLNGKLYLFSSLANSKTKKKILSVQEIDKQSLKPQEIKTKIAEIDFAGEQRYNSGEFMIRVSRDSSKVLAVYKLPFEKNEPEGFGFHVFTDSFKPLWSKDVKVPYENELFDIETVKVDNDGDVYLLGLIYKEKRKSKRRGSPNYTYQVFAFLENGNVKKEYPLSLEDRFLTDMQIEILNNKNLVCAGFYSEKGTYSIRGTYFLTVDAKTKEIKTKSFKEFGIDFIIANMTEGEATRTKRKEEKGGENELYEYDLDKLLVGKDGGAMLLGEQYFVKTVTQSRMVNGTWQYYSTNHYYYNDIIAVKINPAGQIEWAEKIAKRQHTTEDGGFFSSYSMAIVKGNICFVFNDNPKNIGYTGAGKVFNYRGGQESVVTLVSLDPSGKQVRQPLFTSADVEVIVRPKVCEQITSSDIILFGQRRKTQQFARVTF
jgi:hypothetical protein